MKLQNPSLWHVKILLPLFHERLIFKVVPPSSGRSGSVVRSGSTECLVKGWRYWGRVCPKCGWQHHEQQQLNELLHYRKKTVFPHTADPDSCRYHSAEPHSGTLWTDKIVNHNAVPLSIPVHTATLTSHLPSWSPGVLEKHSHGHLARHLLDSVPDEGLFRASDGGQVGNEASWLRTQSSRYMSRCPKHPAQRLSAERAPSVLWNSGGIWLQNITTEVENNRGSLTSPTGSCWNEETCPVSTSVPALWRKGLSLANPERGPLNTPQWSGTNQNEGPGSSRHTGRHKWNVD